ncbi:AAA family ATPase [Bremerella sp.]|uniref:AAA family ATPase n=1 Tax=Bremerella sp. TaxID=2795602 RepID=UPI00391C7015
MSNNMTSHDQVQTPGPQNHLTNNADRIEFPECGRGCNNSVTPISQLAPITPRWDSTRSFQTHTLCESENYINPWIAPREEDATALAHVLRCTDLHDCLFGEHINTWNFCFAGIAQGIVSAAYDFFIRHGRIPEGPESLFRLVSQSLIAEFRGLKPSPGQLEQTREMIEQAYSLDIMVVDKYHSGEVIRNHLLNFGVTKLISNANGKGPLALGMAVEKIHAIQDLIRELQQGGGQVRRLTPLSVKELRRAARPPEWFVRDVMVRDETMFIAGPMKALKSGIAVDLAVALSSPIGGPIKPTFLNHFDVNPVNHVLLFSAESGKWVTLQRIDNVTASRPSQLAHGRRMPLGTLPLADRLNLSLVFDPPQLAIKKDQETVRRHIRERGAQVVIFDPFYLIALTGSGVEASNVMQMGPLIRIMEDVCKDEGATPVFVHHFNKSIKVGTKPELKDMTFAGAGEVAAQWLLLNHRVGFDSETGDCRLWMQFGGRAGQYGLLGVDIHEGRLDEEFRGREWRVSVLDHEEVTGSNSCGRQSSRAQRDLERQHDILKHLANLAEGSGESLNAILRAVNSRSDTCHRSLQELVTQRLVEETTVTRNGRNYSGWRLTQAGRERLQRSSQT